MLGHTPPTGRNPAIYPVTGADRDDAIAFIVTTHSRAERYLPGVKNLIEAFWHEHPPLTFFTDGDTLPAADVVSVPGLAWLDVLRAGLAQIRQELPRTTHVFYMIEDHCPLRRCDADRLDRIFAIARRRDLAAISFPTYPWPWHETESTIYPDGLLRTWRRPEILQIDDELLALVPPDFFRYFQVQPTLWRLDYLEAVCANAKAQGITDAWSFEAMRWPDARPHYVSAYAWPSVHHGFLMQGRINPAAIVYLDRKRARAVHRSFVREAIGVESPLLFDSLQLYRRGKGVLHRHLTDLRKRFSAQARSGDESRP